MSPDADYALCCLEGAFTGERHVDGLSALPRRRTALAYSLKEVGFDLVNMASNHAMDGLARRA